MTTEPSPGLRVAHPTYHLPVAREQARALAAGGLRDAAIGYINAVEAARKGLATWQSVLDHPAAKDLSDAVKAGAACVQNLHATLTAEAWHHRGRELEREERLARDAER